MNLDEIRKRMDRLNNKSAGSKSTSDYKSTFWKPQEGEKSIVRIVPYQHNKDIPFTELYFYFGIDKPRMIALSNFEEQDPILEFATQLRKSGDEDNKTLAKKLYPKMRVFAPVVVRGEEDKGVRFWEFGKMVYQELLGVMMDEDYGDITDVVKGRDITVDVISAKETGKMYPTTTVRVKPKQTPLSEDAEQVEKMLNTQVNIKEFFTKYSFEEMKESLQKYLAVDEGSAEEKEDIQYTKSSAKKSVDDKIDELFD